jgi:hypothetical protein
MKTKPEKNPWRLLRTDPPPRRSKKLFDFLFCPYYEDTANDANIWMLCSVEGWEHGDWGGREEDTFWRFAEKLPQRAIYNRQECERRGMCR